MIEQEDITNIEISSGFGHNTQRPYVQMIVQFREYRDTQRGTATG